MSGKIFISHASADDDFVKALRKALEESRLPVWVDSRNLRGGDKLAPEIETAIAQARQVIVVLSPNTINSPWVRREIQQALQVEKQRKDDGYRVIPLLLPGVQPSALELWFDEVPLGVKVELKTGGVNEAMPAILAALGERLPTDHQPTPKAFSQPLHALKPLYFPSGPLRPLLRFPFVAPEIVSPFVPQRLPSRHAFQACR